MKEKLFKKALTWECIRIIKAKQAVVFLFLCYLHCQIKSFCPLPTKVPGCPWTPGHCFNSVGEAMVPRAYPKMSLSKMPKTPQSCLY